MSFEAERAEILDRVHDLFIDGSGNEYIPLEWPNKPRPDVTAEDIPVWGRLSIQRASATNREIGSDKTRYYGVVFLEVYTRENTGDVMAAKCADKMRQILQGQTITVSGFQILFREASLKPAGKESGWDHQNVEVPFRRDEL
jgi:hypothetical protein